MKMIKVNHDAGKMKSIPTLSRSNFVAPPPLLSADTMNEFFKIANCDDENEI